MLVTVSLVFPNWSQLLSWVTGISTSLLFFASVVAHELAHSLVGRAQGIPIRSITLFIFGGVAHMTREATRAGAELKMAAAGPACSLAIGGLFGLLWFLTQGILEPMATMALWLAQVNVLLAAFNLIPGFPLDGGRVFRSILWRSTGNYGRSTRIATRVGQGVGYLFILGGILIIFLLPQAWFSGLWLAFIGWFLDNAASASYRQAQWREALHGFTAADVMTSDYAVAPSSIRWSNIRKKVRVLSTAEVEDIVMHFAEAARRAREAGFDGAEIHCAHGYLLSSFLSPYTNRRTDKYGGSTEKRVTIVREIVAQVRQSTGADFPLLLKMNCDDAVEGGIDIDSFPALAKEIAKTGVNAIEISGNNTCRTELDSPEQQSYYMNYAEKLNLDIPLILTGGNKSIERIEKIFQKSKIDFFGFARPLIQEPDLPNRWLKGIDGAECTCISCNRCLYGLGKGTATHCPLNNGVRPL